MKVLVTGGCGFIGSHLVEQLIAAGHQAIVIDDLSTGKRANLHPAATLFTLNILSPYELNEILQQEQPEVVFHLAAQVDVASSIRTPSYDAHINILGSLNLLQACVHAQVRKIIYSSSCAVYGATGDVSISEAFPINPISYYGLSKSVPEKYLQLYQRQHGLAYTVLRYANVYGPRQSVRGEGAVIPLFVQKALAQEPPFIFGDGMQTRDFVYVKDVARANLLAMTEGDQQILNIGTNLKTNLNALWAAICTLTASSQQPIYEAERVGDIRFSQLDPAKAEKMLGWRPLYDLAGGLQETIDDYQNTMAAAD